MSLRPSYPELERNELKFVSEFGWLAAVAFAVIVIVAAMTH